MAETVRSFLTSNGFNEIVVAELEEKLSVRTLDDLSCLNAENLAGLTSLKALQVKKLISLLATRTRGGAGRQVDLELTNTKDGGGGGVASSSSSTPPVTKEIAVNAKEESSSSLEEKEENDEEARTMALIDEINAAAAAARADANIVEGRHPPRAFEMSDKDKELLNLFQNPLWKNIKLRKDKGHRKYCSKLNLQYANLTRADFSVAPLTFANLSHAICFHANFCGNLLPLT
jgi:hypothetical protein